MDNYSNNGEMWTNYYHKNKGKSKYLNMMKQIIYEYKYFKHVKMKVVKKDNAIVILKRIKLNSNMNEK